MKLRKKIRDWLFSDAGILAECHVCGRAASTQVNYGGAAIQMCSEHVSQWSAYAMDLPNHTGYIVSSLRASSMKAGLTPFDESNVNEYLQRERQGREDIERWLDG